MPLDEVSLARAPDGSLLWAVRRSGDTAATCFVCNGPLSWRSAHQRSRNSNPTRTVTFTMRGHFFHVNRSVGGERACTAESVAHAAAKAWLVAAPAPVRFQFRCPDCRTDAVELLLPEGLRIAEYRIAVPGSNGGDVPRAVQPDVVVFDPSTPDVIIAAVEVWKTHACDDSKLEALERSVPGRWFEVCADAF